MDTSLPDGVAAVWLSLAFPTPSLTLLVATFTLTEQAGDLSELLRGDYRTGGHDLRIVVRGRLGALRARIPWTRPRSYRWTQGVPWPEEQKQVACDVYMDTYATACWNWLSANFLGRFSLQEGVERPIVRLLLTTKTVPFLDRPEWLNAVGLGRSHDAWRSTDQAGWWLTTREGWERRPHRMTFAARRADTVSETGSSGVGEETAWVVTQRFHVSQSYLVAVWATGRLLGIYADELARLRDGAARGRWRRPVHQARKLDRFLMGDGLDAATVAPDICAFAENLCAFRWNLAEYEQELGWLPEKRRSEREPEQLVPNLRVRMLDQAKRLMSDLAATTATISASANLRQSISNARLQRATVVLTVLATVIAVVSLFVAWQAAQPPTP